MSMRQYLRQISVEIEDADRSVLIVEELRITFDLHIDDQSSSSPSTVKIWNLGKRSASHIAEPRQIVRVKAGYGDIRNAEPIFDGEIRRVLHEPTGLDRVTTIVLGRSESATTGALVSISLAEPVRLRDLVRRVVDAMGLRIESDHAVPDEELEEGFIYNGSAKSALKELLEPHKVTAYQVGGVMHFTHRYDEPERGTFLLSHGTGLIGTPSLTEDEGLGAKMALNGSIELSQLVEVSSEAVDGWFRVKTLVHRGDNWGGEFVTEIEGTKHEPATVEPADATPQPVAVAPVPLPGGRG